MLQLFAIFAVACLATAGAIPRIRRMAMLRRMLDMPDGGRRSHKRPIPRLGGIAVVFGFTVAVIAAAAWQWAHGGSDARSLQHTAQMLVACAMLFAIGFTDDIRGVSPAAKLLGQTVAALIVQYQWPLLTTIVIPPGITVHLGWLGVPIMVLWLVGVSNALNLVDGLDGLAGGVAIIGLAATVAASGALHITQPIESVALMGAILGFLFFNWAPAKIFMGDSGSLVIGFLLAFLTVRRATTVGGTTLVVVPLFALAYPLLDTAVAIARRWLRGHPLSRADEQHIHHRLRTLGISDQKAVVLIYCYSAGIAALGVSVAFAPPRVTLAIAAAGVLLLAGIFLYGVRWLGYHEFLDAGAVLRSAVSLGRSAIRHSIHARDVAALVATAATLREVDEILGAHAETFGFAHMQVGAADARLPSAFSRDQRSYWKLEYPIAHAAAPALFAAPAGSLVLTVWCAKRSTARAANAERVAHVVGQAIADWSDGVPAAVRDDVRVLQRVPPARLPEHAIEPLRSPRPVERGLGT